MFPVSFQSRLVGVGQEPQTLPSVQSSDSPNRNTHRCRLVGNGLHRIEKIVESHLGEISNFFTNKPSGPDVFNNAKQFRPEDTVIAFDSSTSSSFGVGLAGRRGCDEVAASRLLCSDFSDIPIVFDVGPMSLEDGTWVVGRFSKSN